MLRRKPVAAVVSASRPVSSSWGGGAFADDQACGQDQVVVGDGACTRVENHVHGLAGDHIERLADGGERRVQVLCRVHVVEADDRQVSGQGQAALAGGAVHVERRDVVACEDRSR